MSKEKSAFSGSIVQGLFQVGFYKRSQGKLTRQVTFAVMAIVVSLASWRWNQILSGSTWSEMKYIVPGVFFLGGFWFSFRLVNLPRFADFLIAVEAEINKVSWPSRAELFRSSLVVMFLIFFLAGTLFVYDIFWRKLFQSIGVIHGG